MAVSISSVKCSAYTFFTYDKAHLPIVDTVLGIDMLSSPKHIIKLSSSIASRPSFNVTSLSWLP